MKMKLTRNLITLLIMGAKQCGYGAQDVLVFIGEMLTPKEYRAVEAFLNWVTKNKKTFGHGNIQQVWAEHQASLSPGK